MRYLERSKIKEIEYHLYNSNRERQELERIRDETACRSDYSMSVVYVKASGGSDPVAQSVVLLERRTQKLKKWLELVDAVREKLKGTPQLTFLTMVYVEKLSEVQICDRLFIERRTYYNWKSEILLYAAMKACEMGLITV